MFSNFARIRLPVLSAGYVALALAAGGLAFAQDDGVVARVNGTPITEADVNVALRDFGAALGNIPEDQRRKTLIDLLIDVRLLAQAGEAAQLHETDAFRQTMALQRDKALMDAYLAARAAEAVTDEAIQNVYDEQITSTEPETEIRASHILVETEDEAKAVVQRLESGEDFAAVAKDVSKDPGSGAQGGDLGYFGEGRMIPVFYETAVATDVGARSAPFESQFGWHVLTVTDKREKALPTLEDVRDQIQVYIERRAQQEAIVALREKAEIERSDVPAEAEDAPAENPSNGAN